MLRLPFEDEDHRYIVMTLRRWIFDKKHKIFVKRSAMLYSIISYEFVNKVLPNYAASQHND